MRDADGERPRRDEQPLGLTKPNPIERDTSPAQMGCRIQECGSRVMSL